VFEHLPERQRAAVKPELPEAWAMNDHERALDRLQALGAELERSHPGAAASLRVGIGETLTLTRLGVSGPLKRTLASTNPCESMIECVRRTSRSVKRWQSGEMALRWTAAGNARSRTAVSAGDRLPRPRHAMHCDRTRPCAPSFDCDCDCDRDCGGRDRHQVRHVASTASSAGPTFLSMTCAARFCQTAYPLIRTSPLPTSTVPGAQIWSGFTHAYSGWLDVSVAFSRS
jgi:Transposase, Mutator family